MLGAQTAYKKLLAAIAALPAVKGTKAISSYLDKFTGFINNDLDTPKAIALVWDLLKNRSFTPDQQRATIEKFDAVLGLGLTDQIILAVPAHVQKLVDARKVARDSKDFKKSDELRDEIKTHGFEVKDTPEGQTVKAI